MQITRIKEIPKSWRSYYESSEPYDIDNLRNLGEGKAVYWYGDGGYDGCGHVIFTRNGKFYHHDMGHCSCYGPLEDLETERAFDSLDELISNCSPSLIEEFESLLEVARTWV